MEDKVKEVIDKYSGLVYKVAFFCLKNISDIDDVMQDVYLKLSDNIHKLKDDNHIRAWLVTVTRNTSYNYNKSFWRKHVTSELYEETCAHKEILDEISTLRDKIYELDDIYKNVLVLYVKGYKMKEISRKVKITEDNVKTRIKRAKKLIKDEIYEEGELI